MRLIDADKLLKDMKRTCKGNCKRCEDYTILSSDLHCGLVDRQPTIQPQGIDKDRLIELLNTDMSGCDGDFAEEMAEIIVANMQQSTVEQGWIPVSELPKEDGKYLCTTNHGTVGVWSFSNDLYSVDKYDFAEHKGKKSKGFYAYDSEWGYSEACYIAAYMPLPQPYKENNDVF